VESIWNRAGDDGAKGNYENHTQDDGWAYWKALLALEKAIGVEVDGTQDLQDAMIEHLMEKEGLVLRPGSRTRGRATREQV